VRTTLRYPDFCKGWNALIQLGFTDETKWQIKPALTLEEWFLALSTNPTFKRKLEVFMEDEIIASQLNYLSLTENVILPDYVNSNASLLQWRLEQKWTLNSNDKDLVVMMHEIDYTLDGKQFNAQSSMIIKGIDGSHTAMAKTVGYPLAMGVCAFLNGEISLQGIHLPIHPEIYTPILENLAKEGIIFEEQIKEIKP
jgi:saccharopine dehydrogenase-like NADP-dependent oxidoreductase